MALAPASIVRRMDSSVGPPVAMMGTSGNFSRIFRTTPAVRSAAETFRTEAPAASLAAIS